MDWKGVLRKWHPTCPPPKSNWQGCKAISPLLEGSLWLVHPNTATGPLLSRVRLRTSSLGTFFSLHLIAHLPSSSPFFFQLDIPLALRSSARCFLPDHSPSHRDEECQHASPRSVHQCTSNGSPRAPVLLRTARDHPHCGLSTGRAPFTMTLMTRITMKHWP